MQSPNLYLTHYSSGAPDDDSGLIGEAWCTNLQSAICNPPSVVTWPLIKSLQTGLLLATGIAGYLSAHNPNGTWLTLLGMMGSLFLAISGSTVLNMAYDRDIDAVMARTCWRPLPAGLVGVHEAAILGGLLSALGVGWGLAMTPLYGLVVFAGLFFDAVVYTAWLKRRTPYSILIGGLAGGMPVLAGRVLATGQIDIAGRHAGVGRAFLDSHTHHDLFYASFR